MPVGVKGRRHKPLVRLGSYKPMTFRSWVVDLAVLEQKEEGYFEREHPNFEIPENMTYVVSWIPIME